jgi:hypothetical protein
MAASAICRLTGKWLDPSMRLSRTRVNEDWAGLAKNLDESISSTVIRNRVPKACGARRHQDFTWPLLPRLFRCSTHID